MTTTRVGFLGLGLMGEPIALNLVRAGVELRVWNRTADKTKALEAAGATVAASPAEVFAGSEIVIVMLANAAAMDEVLGRGTPRFAEMVRGRIVVHMGTTAPDYSARLGADVTASGGTYVEAPVSGSRIPAQRGELAGMVAGPPEAVDLVRPLLHHVCTDVVTCGPVPNALMTKLAVNVFLITMVTGLVEAFHFAAENSLDVAAFVRVLDSGPMSSAVSKLKLEKLVHRDLVAQAALADVWQNTVLIHEAAHQTGIATPLVDACLELYAEAAPSAAEEDMIGVLRAHEARTAVERRVR